MPTLSELKSELAEIDQKLHATWLQEREGARRRIVDMAVEFQLNPESVAKDIEAAQRGAAPALSMLRPPRVDLPLRKEGAAQHIATKFRNQATGDAWTGRGPQPRWLRDALEAGALLEDFRVQDFPEAAARDPLREFQDAARRSRLTIKA